LWRPEWIEENGTTKLQASQIFESVFRAKDGSLVNADEVHPIQLKDFGKGSDSQGIVDIVEGINYDFPL
jgi:hypothetical protein